MNGLKCCVFFFKKERKTKLLEVLSWTAAVKSTVKIQAYLS